MKKRRSFKFLSEQEFVALPPDKRAYYLARLYVRADISESQLPFQKRLFPVLNYLKKRDIPELSILYNYLMQNTHEGKMIWELLPRAVMFDQKMRREQKIKITNKYEDFNLSMLEDN